MRTSIKPRVTPETKEFWEGCAQGELRAQRCGGCRRLRFPPQPMCPVCHSMERSWVPSSNHGKVYSFSIVTGEGNEVPIPGSHGFPFAIAIIELECDIRMVTDFDTDMIGELEIGTPVEAIFEQVSDGVFLPRFKVLAAVPS